VISTGKLGLDVKDMPISTSAQGINDGQTLLAPTVVVRPGEHPQTKIAQGYRTAELPPENSTIARFDRYPINPMLLGLVCDGVQVTPLRLV